MKNIFIYAGSKSAKLADYILIKNPKLFSSKVKYDIAIGRAIKTNWGRKSIHLLSKQIEEQGHKDIDLNRELGVLLKKYNNDISFLENKLDVIDEKSANNFFKIPEKIKSKKVFGRLQGNKLEFHQIVSILDSENIEMNDDFLGFWLSKCTEVKEDSLLNIINYLENLVKIDSAQYLQLRLAQAYALNMQLGQSRDAYFKYTLFYNTTSSINYAIGNNNKIFINKLFQREESLIAHPLLDKRVANNFFNNHDEFIENYYTDAWKEVLSIDYELRKNYREDLDKKEEELDKNILFVTNANWNFLTTMIEEFEYKSNNIDVYDYSFLSKLLKNKEKSFYNKVIYSPLSVLTKEDGINTEYFRKIDPAFFEKLDRADVVFCEWGNEAAIFLSRFAPPTTKIVVRIHSYEVFTFWHLFINLGGIDGFIFVAPHIKKIFLKNASSNYYGHKMISNIEVIPNVKDYSCITKNKSECAEFSLGLAGFNKINKGLMKALNILNKLYLEDSRWKLRLAGNHFEIESIDYAYWKNICEPYIIDNNLEKAVVFDGYQNIPEWLKNIGFILSTSEREGTHEALVEGVSSGAIPLIIDWDMVKRFGGVSELYPFLAEYIFDDVQAMNSINTKDLHKHYNTNRLALSQSMQEMHEPKKVVKNIYKFIGSIYEA